MSKLAFIEKRFNASSQQIIEKAEEICQDYASQGYDLSLRQLYYQFVAKALIENSEKSYKRIGSIISDARLAGLLDWSYIKDRGRETITNSHWNNPGEILEACAKQFSIDTWENQSNHVEVMVEKQALEGVLLPVCRKMDVAFTANKGYSSSSALYEMGQRLQWRNWDGKDLHVIYLGDHDPSGIDMTRDINERLRMFSACVVNVHRVALNMDQILRYNPPENPAKETDARAASYIAEYGESSWELDALEPRVLAKIVEQKIQELLDPQRRLEALEKQRIWRGELKEMAQKYLKADSDDPDDLYCDDCGMLHRECTCNEGEDEGEDEDRE